jgi:hypothetical protein
MQADEKTKIFMGIIERLMVLLHDANEENAISSAHELEHAISKTLPQLSRYKQKKIQKEIEQRTTHPEDRTNVYRTAARKYWDSPEGMARRKLQSDLRTGKKIGKK